MKAALAVWALWVVWGVWGVWGVWAARAGGAAPSWPECLPGAACVAGEPAYVDDWDTRNYVVEGKQLWVSVRGDAVRWRCAPGVRVAAPAAPTFRVAYMAHDVRLVDCELPPDVSYATLLKRLLATDRLSDITLDLAARRRGRWPTADELKRIKVLDGNEPEYLAARAADSGVRHLALRGVAPTAARLASVMRRVETLTLARTGLEELPDLSAFSELRRLEVDEPALADARRLRSAPALRSLVLRARGAGLAALPRLRDATFLDVDVTGSVFGACESLEELTLRGGRLASVRGRWLAGCGRLRTLRLTRLPGLRTLPRGLLADAAALRTLDLSGDGLEELPADLLAGAANVTRLDLSRNALRSLPAGLFAGAAALVWLDLSHNGLKWSAAADALVDATALPFVYLCDDYMSSEEPSASEGNLTVTVERDRCPSDSS